LGAAAELKSDRDVVLTAVAQDNRALLYPGIPAELKADPIVCELSALNPRVSVRSRKAHPSRGHAQLTG
jgi:hypothetical protein